MASDEHIRKGNAREMLQIIWNRMGYTGLPGISPYSLERGVEALAIALDAQTGAAMRLQLEIDCAVICRYCRRTPELGAAHLTQGTHMRMLWRHSIVRARGRHGYVTCLANALRERWQAEHSQESTDA